MRLFPLARVHSSLRAAAAACLSAPLLSRRSPFLFCCYSVSSAGPAAASLSCPWSSLPLSSAMLAALSALELHGGATSIQQAGIRSAASLASSEQQLPTALLLAARTGTGKTLAALIPTMERAMEAERTDNAQRAAQADRHSREENNDQPSNARPAPTSSPATLGSSQLALDLSTAALAVPPPPAPSSPRLLSPASLFSPSSSSSRPSRVLCRPLSVVVVPSRELVDQHYRSAKQLSHHLPVRVERLIAGRSRAKERRDLSSVTAAAPSSPPSRPQPSPPQQQRAVSVLVSTPGRLLSYIDRGLVSLSELRTVVLDEADVLLSAATEGGFKDDCVRLVKLAVAAARPSAAATTSSSSSSSSSSSPLFMLLAASVPRSLRSLLFSLFSRVLDLSSPQLHTLPPSVLLSFVFVHAGDKLDKLVSLVRDIVTSHPQPRVLLFCNSLGSCRAVLAALTLHFQQQPLPPHVATRYSHSPVLAHHGDLPSQLRTSHLQSFRSGQCCVLVVTDLLSRGLDMPQLSHVVQFDMSLNPTDFMHRVGRLARQPLSASQQEEQQKQQHAVALVRKGDEILAKAIAAQFQASRSIAELSSDRRHYSRI